MEITDVLIIIGIVVCVVSVITGVKCLCKEYIKQDILKKRRGKL